MSSQTVYFTKPAILKNYQTQINEQQEEINELKKQLKIIKQL